MPPASLSALPSAAALTQVWRVDELAAGEAVLPTGHAALNAWLPGGGWPLDGLVEVLQARPGQHVWQLLLPALAQAGQGGPPVVAVPVRPRERHFRGLLEYRRENRFRVRRPCLHRFPAHRLRRCCESAPRCRVRHHRSAPENRRIRCRCSDDWWRRDRR